MVMDVMKLGLNNTPHFLVTLFSSCQGVALVSLSVTPKCRIPIRKEMARRCGMALLVFYAAMVPLYTSAFMPMPSSKLATGKPPTYLPIFFSLMMQVSALLYVCGERIKS